MRRGEVWTVAGGEAYTGKPRPAVIVQADSFADTASVTVCPFTSDPTDAPLLRLKIEPSGGNGLTAESRLMVDKVTTVPRARLGERIGRLSDASLVRLNAALATFLGLAG
jgi:mRNA interferase MazF